MPSTVPRAPNGLECWLIGTREEIAAATEALAGVLTVVDQSVGEPLPNHRRRQYLRGLLPLPSPAATPDQTSPQQIGHEQCEITYPSPSSGT